MSTEMEENEVQSKKYRGRRISIDQRMHMLDFMVKHTALANARSTEPDWVKKKLLQQLANELNSLPNGTWKSTDKWMKSWQDWRSDVRTKASRIKKMQKTGALNVKPLTPMEERLIDFLGPSIGTEYEELQDPLTLSFQDLAQLTKNDSDDEDAIEIGEYVVLPKEESTIMSVLDISSANELPALTTPLLASPAESIPCTSEFVPVSEVTESSCPTTTKKKRKRNTSGTADADDEDVIEIGKYVVLPKEESTIMSALDISSANELPALTTPPLASPAESIPCTSEFVPVSEVSESSCPTTTKKRRKRSTSHTASKEDDPLVDITKQQLICMQEQNIIRRAQLQLNKRKTVAIENAAQAFVEAMKGLGEYLRHRRND